MQIHTEFRYDPPQGRRACEGGEARQEWVEFMMCPSLPLSELWTTARSRFEGAVVQSSAAGGAGQPSSTVPNSVHFEA